MVITITCLYNFDPHKPHFYIVKLGFTGVYIIFHISAQNIDCGYSLELPPWAVLTSTHNLCFEQKYEKYRSFLSEKFQFLEMKFSIYLNRRVFVMYGRKRQGRRDGAYISAPVTCGRLCCLIEKDIREKNWKVKEKCQNLQGLIQKLCGHSICQRRRKA